LAASFFVKTNDLHQDSAKFMLHCNRI